MEMMYLAAEEPQPTKPKYESVMEFFTDGYGRMAAVALMNFVESCLPSLIKDGYVPGEEVLDCHWALCALLKAVVKDEYGVDLGSIRSADDREEG